MVKFIVMDAKWEARTKLDHGRSGTWQVCCHTSDITASIGWGPNVRLDIDQLRSNNRRIRLSFARNPHKDERVSSDYRRIRSTCHSFHTQMRLRKHAL